MFCSDDRDKSSELGLGCARASKAALFLVDVRKEARMTRIFEKK
jgi:hypothetical protein